MKTIDRSFANLFTRYALAIAIIPNLIFAGVINGCHSEQFAHFAIVGILLFIPMTLYYFLPALVSGGYGFVGQMGVGPENKFGFIIAAFFWSIISFILVKMKLHLRSRKANQRMDQPR